MGLSCLPNPSQGVICVIIVNTVSSISIFKHIIRTILHIVGINTSSSPPASDPIENPSPSATFVEEFRSRIPTVQFDSVCKSGRQFDHDCLVCLNQFEPGSEINRLSCGHVYHKVCLEKWLDYWNITCPLCRTPLMPPDETSSCLW